MRIKAKFLYLYSRCDRFGQAAPRQPANLFAIAPCLHYVLDRRRFGKMQVNLLLPSACTIFTEHRRRLGNVQINLALLDRKSVV